MTTRTRPESPWSALPASPPVISGRQSPWRVMDPAHRSGQDSQYFSQRRYSTTSQEVAHHTQRGGRESPWSPQSGRERPESPWRSQNGSTSHHRSGRESPWRSRPESPWRNHYGGSMQDLAHRSGRESPWRTRPESPWRSQHDGAPHRSGRESPWRSRESPRRSGSPWRSQEISQKSGRQSPWRVIDPAQHEHDPARSASGQKSVSGHESVRPGRESPWREMRQRSSSPWRAGHEASGRESPWREVTGSFPRSGRESPWREATGSFPRSGRESPWREATGSFPRSGRESPWRVKDPAHRALETPRTAKTQSSPDYDKVLSNECNQTGNGNNKQTAENNKQHLERGKENIQEPDGDPSHQKQKGQPDSVPSTPRMGRSGREISRILVKGRSSPIKAINPEFNKQLARNRSSWSGTAPPLAWGTSKLDPNVKLLKTSSFLQRAREAQERERNRLGLQDDSIVPRDTSHIVKPRQRRIESFHGSRSRLRSTSNSVLTSPVVVPNLPNQSKPAPVPQDTQVAAPSNSNSTQNEKGDNSEQNSSQMDTEAKLKGWPTVENLSQRSRLQQQLLLQQQQQQQQQQQDRSYPSSQFGNHEHLQENKHGRPLSSGQLAPAVSTPSLNMAANQWTGNYQTRYPSQSPVQPPSSLSLAKSNSDIHNGYRFGQGQGSSLSPSGGIAQDSSNIDQNRNLGYSNRYNYRSPSQQSVSYRGNYQMEDGMKSQEIDSPQNLKSVPPPYFKNQQNDYQNITELKAAGLYKFPQKIEQDHEGEGSKQQDCSPSSPPPPTPPRRDNSSLKYVHQTTAKSHEKYPSWPVTQPNADMEACDESVTSQVGAWPVRDKPNLESSQKGYKPQLIPVNERTSPNSERKTSDQENKRNQSDPGFKKEKLFKPFIKRPTKEEIQQSQNSVKRNSSNEYVDKFFRSEPGYPKPLMDQDGNRIGDAKYSIPSPPERDHPGLDKQSLQEKIASIVVPVSDSNLHQYTGNPYKSDLSRTITNPVQSPRDNKMHEFYKSTLHSSGSELSKSAALPTSVDSSTSPQHSPKEIKYPQFGASVSGNPKDHPSAQIQQYSNNTRGLIVKQTLYYNTGTQTDVNARQNQINQSVQVTSQLSGHDNDKQDKVIRTSLGSESDGSAKTPSVDTSKSSHMSPHFDAFSFSQSSGDENRSRNNSAHENRSSGEIRANFGEDDSQNCAPMLRKLSQEYISGKMHGFENKRLSGDSGFFTSGARSPGSEQYPFPVMREAESYNSVIIHPNESSHPFGKDFIESDTDEMHHKDVVKSVSDRRSYPVSETPSTYKSRYSLDSSTPVSKFLPGKKGLKDQRYSSEANLIDNSMHTRDHSQSMLSLTPKHGKSESYSGGYYPRPSSAHSSESSSMSHQSGPRSSTNSQVSPQSGQLRARRESNDSVFLDLAGEKLAGNTSDMSPASNDPSAMQRKLGRNTSMKLAYGVYDESDKSVPSNLSQLRTGAIHGKSRSVSDYMPMNQYSNRPSSLGQIREDSSETRWEEALKKSRSLRPSSSGTMQEESNYANIDPLKMEKNFNRSLQEGLISGTKQMTAEKISPFSEKEEAAEARAKQEDVRPPLPKRDIRSPVNSSAMIKQSKSELSQDNVKSPSVSQNDLQSNVDKPSSAVDSDMKNTVSAFTSLSQFPSEKELKDKQRYALQNFMERKTGKRTSSSDSDHDQTQIPPSPSADKPNTTQLSNDDSLSASRHTPTPSYREKYARRQESLRRSRSVTARDSADYVHMVRPSQPHPQTEWSRIRSQTSSSDGSVRRPLSIGSETGLVDPYAVSPITGVNSVLNDGHGRSQSDSSEVPPVINGSTKTVSMATTHPHYSMSNSQSASGSVSSGALDYVNVRYRRPPPLPPSDDDKPPALPPRNYRAFHGSVSDSSLLGHQHGQKDSGDISAPPTISRKPRDDSPDDYAAQLRLQARRFSEQQNNLMPTSMSYIATRTVTHFSQTSKRSPVEALEATHPGTVPPSTSSSLHQMPYSAIQSMGTPSPSTINSQANHQHFKDVQPRSANSMPQQQLTPTTMSLSFTSPGQSSARRDSENKLDTNQNVSNNQHTSSSPISYARPPDIGSPELPPPPTPMKNPEELSALNDLDLPPPPPELIEEDHGTGEENSECADDSYGSHKIRSARPIGTYKRSVSSGDILKKVSENNNYKDQSALQQPQRRLLGQQPWGSEAAINQAHVDSVESGIVAESVAVNTAVKSVAPSIGYSQSTSALQGPKPFQVENQRRLSSSASEKTNNNESATSVRDRISRFETSSSSPQSQSSARSNVNNLKKSFDFNRGQDGSADTPTRSRNERITSTGSYRPMFTENRHNVHYIGQFGAENEKHGNGHLLDKSEKSADGRESLSSTFQQSCDNNEKQNALSNRDISSNTARDLSQNHSLPYQSNDQNDKPPDVPPKRFDSSQMLHSKSGGSDIKSHTNKLWENKTINSPPQNVSPQFVNNSNQHPQISHVSNGRTGGYNSQYANSVSNVPEQKPVLSISHNRQPSQEELECDQRVHAFAKNVEGQDKTLSQVLKQDNLGRMDYMSKFVPEEVSIVSATSRHSPKSSISVFDREQPSSADNSVSQEEHNLEQCKSPIPDNYWVSPSKALIEIDIRQSEDLGKKMTEGIADPDSLIKTKEELVESIMKKREKLKKERAELSKEIKDVDHIGNQVKDTVTKKCKQKEREKFMTYLQERDKIIHLLLKMSGLLARAENALQGLPDHCESGQRDMATQKRDRYKSQHEEATKLKEDIDKRSVQVLTILKESLTEQEIEDYKYFINMKSKLTIEMQELDDKLTLGDEQIKALRKSIPERR